MTWPLCSYILDSLKSKNKNKREGLSIQRSLLDRIWPVLKHIAKHIMQILISLLETVDDVHRHSKTRCFPCTLLENSCIPKSQLDVQEGIANSQKKQPSISYESLLHTVLDLLQSADTSLSVSR